MRSAAALASVFWLIIKWVDHLIDLGEHIDVPLVIAVAIGSILVGVGWGGVGMLCVAFEGITLTFVVPFLFAIIANNILFGFICRLLAFGLDISKFHWYSSGCWRLHGTFGICINIVDDVGGSLSKQECMIQRLWVLHRDLQLYIALQTDLEFVQQHIVSGFVSTKLQQYIAECSDVWWYRLSLTEFVKFVAQFVDVINIKEGILKHVHKLVERSWNIALNLGQWSPPCKCFASEQCWSELHLFCGVAEVDGVKIICNSKHEVVTLLPSNVGGLAVFKAAVCKIVLL